MSVVSAPHRHTAEDLERLSARGHHYQLIDGELIDMIPPGGEHGGMTMDLTTYVNVHILSQNLGRGFAAETGFLVARDPDTVLAPDFAFIAHERLPIPMPRGYVPIVPDLVLETRSPHDTRREVADKVARWLALGVRLVWEMDPSAHRLTVYRPNQAPVAFGPLDPLEGGDVLPGFSLRLSLVFRGAADSPAPSPEEPPMENPG